jgi:CubicO group peptidase (beta-lactamase class C family)
MAQPDTRFRVGSVTKTMVATCILKLEEDGLLSIDGPIDNYLRATLISDTLNPSQRDNNHKAVVESYQWYC